MNYVSRPELAATWLQEHFSEDVPPDLRDLLDGLPAALRPLSDLFLLKMVAKPLAQGQFGGHTP